MNKKKSLISPKYTNLNLLTEEEKKNIKREIPWEHYVLDDFIEYKALKRMQKTLLSKKHNFSIQEGDVNQVQFTLLRYLPLARIFYSIEFKSLLERFSNTSLSLNTSNYVQLRYMSPEAPAFPIHVDDLGFKSLVVVYYFSPDWVEGAGGEVCLYNNEFEDESQALAIKPIENRLFFFFSDDTNWHSIRKVNNWDRYTILSEWIVKKQNKVNA